MDAGHYTFVLSFPPAFEADLLAGRQPQIGLAVDATAMSQAGNGVAYIQEIALAETARYLQSRGTESRGCRWRWCFATPSTPISTPSASAP